MPELSWQSAFREEERRRRQATLIRRDFMSVVLIVEDEAQVLVLAESILQGAGYDTLSASTVAEALAIVQSDGPIDLLFTDLGLGDQLEGGLSIGQAVARSRPGLPILYTSGRELTDGMTALFVKPNAFLAKPYTADQLLNSLVELLGS